MLNDEGVTTRFFDGVEFLNMTNAARYVGYSGTGFKNLLARLKGTPEEIKSYEFGGRSRDRYVRKSDLDRYFSPKEVQE